MIYEAVQNKTKAYLAKEGIIWHHISPRSPHFGGLWEAGAKSVQRHLTKTFGEALFNVEEMYTVLAQIKACLNSHPLAPLRAAINDNESLTLGYFPIGNSMFAIPQSFPDNLSTLRR